jgi:hypothetical protein
MSLSLSLSSIFSLLVEKDGNNNNNGMHASQVDRIRSLWLCCDNFTRVAPVKPQAIKFV